MLAKAPKEMSGVVSTATANMSLYRDPIVARNTACCDFRIIDLMNHETPANLYLVVSPADIDRTRPLFRIFVSQLSGRLMEKMEFAQGGTKATYKHRLLLMFDEFTSLGKLAIIERAIAYMAGYGIKGYFIVQSTKQLNAAYGQDNALMENCHVRIAYAPNTIETAEVLSKMTGTTTVVQYKKTLSKGGTSLSVSEVARPLLTPDECMRLPGIKKVKGMIESGDMLIFTAGNSAIYGRQILHFLDPVFLSRASIPPSSSDSLYFHEYETKVVETKVVETASERTDDEESAADAYLRYLDDLPEEVAA
jgi:type IV secretion system protein VirD4